MQKLKTNQNGSVLVGVVAFTAILAIAIATSIKMIRNMEQHEQLAYDEARLVGAVESGVLLGSAYVAQLTTWPITAQNDLFQSAPLTVNGVTVQVAIAPVSGNNNQATITCTASNNGSYQKSVSVKVGRGTTTGTTSVLATHAIYSGQTLEVQGGTSGVKIAATDGEIYGKEGITFTGNPEVDAKTLASEGTITTPGAGSEITSTLSNVQPENAIAFPDIDLSLFKNTATVITSLSQITVPGTKNDIYYVNTDMLEITTDNFQFNGTIIAKKDIHIKAKNVTLGTVGRFALISETGNLTIDNMGNYNTIINGAIYLKSGGFDSDKLTLNGQVIANKDIETQNNTLIDYKPLDADLLKDIVIIGTTKPKILANSWNESNSAL